MSPIETAAKVAGRRSQSKPGDCRGLPGSKQNRAQQAATLRLECTFIKGLSAQRPEKNEVPEARCPRHSQSAYSVRKTGRWPSLGTKLELDTARRAGLLQHSRGCGLSTSKSQKEGFGKPLPGRNEKPWRVSIPLTLLKNYMAYICIKTALHTTQCRFKMSLSEK